MTRHAIPAPLALCSLILAAQLVVACGDDDPDPIATTGSQDATEATESTDSTHTTDATDTDVITADEGTGTPDTTADDDTGTIQTDATEADEDVTDASGEDAAATETDTEDAAATETEDVSEPGSEVTDPVEDASEPPGDGTEPDDDVEATDETEADATEPEEDVESTDPCEGVVVGAILEPVKAGCSDGTREGFLSAKKYPAIAGCGGAWDIPGIHEIVPACERKAGNSGEIPLGAGCNVTDLCAEGWHVCLGATDVKNRNPKGCGGCMDCVGDPAFYLARTSSVGAFKCAPDAVGDPTTENDLFGCGDMGCAIKTDSCKGDGSKCTSGELCPGCMPGWECKDGSVCEQGPCHPLTRASHDGCAGLRTDVANCTWDAVKGKWTGGWACWCAMPSPTMGNTWDCGPKGSTEAAKVVKDNPDVQGGVLCCADEVEEGTP